MCMTAASTPSEPSKKLSSLLTKAEVTDALTTVFDPELEIDVVTLGLIYDIEVSAEQAVKIRMTMTTAACPFAGQLVASVKEAVLEAGASDVEVDVVFDPPWKPSAELRAMMGV